MHLLQDKLAPGSRQGCCARPVCILNATQHAWLGRARHKAPESYHIARLVWQGSARGPPPRSCQLRSTDQASNVFQSGACSARPRAIRLVRLVPDDVRAGPAPCVAAVAVCARRLPAACRICKCLQVVRATLYCVEGECSRRAIYNLEGGSPMYCIDHKHADMVPPLAQTLPVGS